MTPMWTSTRVAFLLTLALAVPAGAQQPDTTLLSIRRIYGSTDFVPESFGPAQWTSDGTAYTTLEPAASGRGQDLVRYDVERGTREVLVAATSLVPPGAPAPLRVEQYELSADGRTVLIFTNSQPVWRRNTRGDYWLFDRTAGTLRKLGGPAKPSTLMFAKLSPDGRKAGYVRENNLYVEDLATGRITQLTTDGSRTIINGTFDWVYEEELDLRDGWRWSPDGRRIAYWQLDASLVRDFYLINDTDSLYSRVIPVQYPKAGGDNSAARIGVVPVEGGPTTWLAIDGDPRQQYLARMDWAANADEIAIQRLNRLQNTNDLLLANATTGQVRTLLTERDSAWVEVVDDLLWLDGGKSFLWTSERDGWTHVYRVSRDGRSVLNLTPGAFDVLAVSGVDTENGWLYFIASPDNPTQRYLFRTRLDGKGQPERVSPAGRQGTHSYVIAPGARWAFHTWSTLTTPPTMRVVRLPSHTTVRTLVHNAALTARVNELQLGAAEFFQVTVPDGTRLNGYVLKPRDFDPSKRYPVLFYVYGGPGSQTVLDAWAGSTYLWFRALNQRGIVVVSVDNRGTGARGRDFRKVIYGRLGVVETADQADAARAIAQWPWVDPSRIGIFGWSFGGFMSLNALFQAPDVYRMAMAVAPVTHWKYYDTIYTERYNGLPQLNPSGYDAGSPLTYVDRLRGRLLLVHGSGDDNVHYQNAEVLVNALVAANKPFTLMVYPNRNHSITGGNATLHLRELLTRFAVEHLAAPAVTGQTAVGAVP